MADRLLTDAYLDALEHELPLSPAERAAALEEIAGHLADATADLVSRGVPVDAAERQALERLGAPRRLASDLAAAHRSPRDLLTAAGVALRVTVSHSLLAFVTTVVIVFTVGLVLALLYALANRFVSMPRITLGPAWEGVLVASAIGLAAYAAGRALPTPVAIAAHRPVAAVRPVLLVIGVVLSGWIALTWINLRWSTAGAALMLLVPAWFALGIRFPSLLPRWLDTNSKAIGVGLLAVILVTVGGLAVAGAPAQFGDSAPRQVDPRIEWGAIATFDDWEQPPLESLTADDAITGVPMPRGTGPLTWTQQYRLAGSRSLDGWTDLQFEVWAAESDPTGGPSTAVGTAPVSVVPLHVHGRRAVATATIEAMPTREFYWLAVTGVDGDGQRQLLAWPGLRSWTWYGTPLDFWRAVAN